MNADPSPSRPSWRRFMPSREAVPEPHDWLRLVAGTSTYLLLIAFTCTAVAKAGVVAGLAADESRLRLLVQTLSTDALFFLGFTVFFALTESVSWRARFFTIPMAALILLASLVNAIYVGVAGDQLTLHAVQVGLARLDDLLHIAVDLLRQASLPSLILLVAVLVGLRIGAGLALRRLGGTLEPPLEARRRGLVAGLLATVALLVHCATPAPRSLAAQRLRSNALVQIYVQWAFEPSATLLDSGTFEGYDPPELVSMSAIEQFAAGPRAPNVLVLVAESTRYDHTSLAGDATAAATPNLAELARQGFVAHRARATVPHTTKALFSLLCGRLPIMQSGFEETAREARTQCLPEILSVAGYRTGFFQSSRGTFEDRPRLAYAAGFQDFTSWETIRGEALGYVASDDHSMIPALGAWLDARAPGEPFFATLLTSATHHPYKLPARLAMLYPGGLQDYERYAILVEAVDQLLGDAREALAARGLLDDTIIVVIGDHGEGFGEKGVRQHDANFYEEGLRVPFVIAGPRVPALHTQVNASVADLTPTLLGLLGIPLSPEATAAIEGRDLLNAPPDETTPRYFGCWFEERCRGFVLGDRKVVVVPYTEETFYFDLAADPDERRPRPLPLDLAVRLPDLHEVVDAHRRYGMKVGTLTFTEYPAWDCSLGRACTPRDAPPEPPPLMPSPEHPHGDHDQ